MILHNIVLLWEKDLFCIIVQLVCRQQGAKLDLFLRYKSRWKYIGHPSLELFGTVKKCLAQSSYFRQIKLNTAVNKFSSITTGIFLKWLILDSATTKHKAQKHM